MNVQRPQPPVMGNFFAALAASAQEFFTAKGGQVIVAPGAPAALSMSLVGILAGSVVLVAMLKKQKVI